jgi:hypothetical protein
MQDTMSSSVNAPNDARWEDEPARPLWSSSGSSEQTPAERAALDRRRRIERDGNTLLF